SAGPCTGSGIPRYARDDRHGRETTNTNSAWNEVDRPQETRRGCGPGAGCSDEGELVHPRHGCPPDRVPERLVWSGNTNSGTRASTAAFRKLASRRRFHRLAEVEADRPRDLS